MIRWGVVSVSGGDVMRFTAIVQPLSRACHNGLFVALLAAGGAALCGAAPAQAQFLFGGWRTRAPAQQSYLSPREVTEIIEDYGYRPVGRPRLTGALYVAEGRDARGYRTRFVVDAVDGNVVSRAVLATPLDRRLDLEAIRPPGGVPDGQRQASRSTDPTLFGPRLVPGQRPAEGNRARSKAQSKPQSKPPVTAARPAVPEVVKPAVPALAPNLAPNLAPTVAPSAPEANRPADAAKPPVTAARPPAAAEPLPAAPTATPSSFEVAKPPPATAVVPPATARRPSIQATPAPGASTVPPVLLDDVRPKALPEPPPMVPPVTLD
jgi:hypothetical protein